MFSSRSGLFGRARAGDPYYDSVSLLLHCDGANGSQTFTDNSKNAFGMTAVGNGQITTTSPKFGTGAFISDGTGDYLQTTSAAAASGPLDLSSGDLTIEMWLNMVSNGGGILSWGNSFPSSYGGEIYFSSGKVQVNKNATTGILVAASTFPTGAWTHLAITRATNTWRIFINGTLDASTSNSNGFDLAVGASFYLFGNAVEGVFSNGSKGDDFRITKGVARYTASFTPPTVPYPNSK